MKANAQVTILKTTYDFVMSEMNAVHKTCDLLGVPRKDGEDNLTAAQRLRRFQKAYAEVLKEAAV